MKRETTSLLKCRYTILLFSFFSYFDVVEMTTSFRYMKLATCLFIRLYNFLHLFMLDFVLWYKSLRSMQFLKLYFRWNEIHALFFFESRKCFMLTLYMHKSKSNNQVFYSTSFILSHSFMSRQFIWNPMLRVFLSR